MHAPMASSETKSNVRHVLLWRAKNDRAKNEEEKKNGALETVNSADISHLFSSLLRIFRDIKAKQRKEKIIQ